jgi:hypothetical protein
MGTAQEKDGKFVAHLHKLFGTVDSKSTSNEAETTGHKNFLTPKFGNDLMFIIVHYAGEVSLSRVLFHVLYVSLCCRIHLTLKLEPLIFVCVGSVHCRWLCREEYGDAEQRTARAWRGIN